MVDVPKKFYKFYLIEGNNALTYSDVANMELPVNNTSRIILVSKHGMGVSDRIYGVQLESGQESEYADCISAVCFKDAFHIYQESLLRTTGILYHTFSSPIFTDM
jgi:hypothetical protein